MTSDIKVTPAEVRRYFKDMPEDSLPWISDQVEVQIITQQPRIPQEEIERVKANCVIIQTASIMESPHFPL